MKKPTLRLLIPDAPVRYCTKFDLSNAAARKRIRDEIWPAVLAHKDEVLANPADLESIVERWHREQHAARAEAKKVEQVKRAVVAITAAGQEPCIMFGVTLWPRPGNDFGTYDYDQIRAAAWSFRDWERWLDKGSSPASKAICIRNMVRWLVALHDRVNPASVEPHAVRKALSLIGTISKLYEKNPTGECRIPCDPKIEGQWG
jgi:hypothetical protein